MQNARHICSPYQLNIRNFNQSTSFANYEEPRIYNRERLLQISFQNALTQLKRAGLHKKPFILEDTSVDIHSLTDKYGYEFPGLDIKYWMREIQFEDLDLELSMLGNDRSVTVRSDLLLYLPEVSDEPFHFIGCTKGLVVDTAQTFETNIIYPWLDNKTFNKWFIPSGEKSVLSMLPIEKADIHDFRRKAFLEMFNVLEKYNILKKKELPSPSIKSTDSWIERINCHLVYGLSCAGKTTIASYLINQYDFLHVEASDFMHVIYRETHGLNSNIPIGSFAKEILKSSPIMVAERVLKYVEDIGSENVVITGFRLPDEVNYIENNLENTHNVKKILITAKRSIRLKRKNLRNRTIDPISEENLEERDERELEMGIAKLISDKSSNIEIVNEGEPAEFYNSYCEKLKIEKISPQNRKKNSDFNSLTLKESIILALYVARGDSEKSDYLTTTQITNLINSNGLKSPKFVSNRHSASNSGINLLV